MATGGRTQRDSMSQSTSTMNRSVSTPGRRLSLDPATSDPDSKSLVKSLRILQRYKKVQEMKHKAPATRKTKGKGTASAPRNQPVFQFTNDMFTRNNTEGLIQVTYQILSTVFPIECDLKFRNCWPTYQERQLESEYRKVAFTWTLEIYEKYPHFFDGKPQFAFFVTPSGSKCIRFLSALAQCGLFILAEHIQAEKGKTLLPHPKLCGEGTGISKPEVLQNIKDANEENVKKCTKLLSQTAKFVVYTERNKAKKNEEAAAQSKTIQQQEIIIREIMNRHPELFPENAESLLHSKLRFYVNDGREFNESMLLADDVDVHDKLLHPLKDEWKQRLTRLREKYEQLGAFVAENKKTTELIDQIVANCGLTIDTRRYPGLFTYDRDVLPEVGHRLVQIPELFVSVRDLFPSSGFLNYRMPHLSSTVSKLIDRSQRLVAEGSAAIACKPNVNKDDLLFTIQLERMALEGTDWNAMLRPPHNQNTTDVAGALNLTPEKPKDFTRTTGLTPTFDYGIKLAPAPESKLSRLMNAIRISETPTGVENTRLTTLKNTGSSRRNLALIGCNPGTENDDGLLLGSLHTQFEMETHPTLGELPSSAADSTEAGQDSLSLFCSSGQHNLDDNGQDLDNGSGQAEIKGEQGQAEIKGEQGQAEIKGEQGQAEINDALGQASSSRSALPVPVVLVTESDEEIGILEQSGFLAFNNSELI